MTAKAPTAQATANPRRDELRRCPIAVRTTTHFLSLPNAAPQLRYVGEFDVGAPGDATLAPSSELSTVLVNLLDGAGNVVHVLPRAQEEALESQTASVQRRSFSGHSLSCLALWICFGEYIL